MRKAFPHYGHNGGYSPLRQMLSQQYNVSPDQVFVGNGSLHLQIFSLPRWLNQETRSC